MLEVRNLHSGYGEAVVIRGVSLDVGAGEIVALLGRNGMGKTTFIRSIMGLAPPLRSGTITWRGEGLVCTENPIRACLAKNRLSWRDDRVDLVCSGRAGLAVQVEDPP
jgi:ABC-type branched-subunit amino acid transport system ATPase component